MSINKDVYNIVQFLKKALKDSGQNGFALGLSGGIDSAVCAALAKRAIDELHREAAPGDDKTYRLDLIVLPMGNHSSDAEVAHEVAASIGMDARTVELDDALSAFLSALHPTAEGHTQPDAKCVGNLKARMRMSAIYYAANVHGLLVLGTDNASETYTGYFTKHGDGAADVFPISPFTKREVYDIGRFLKLPESVLSRAPTAGLWDGQTDEDEMGIPYDFIDNRIEDMEDFNKAYYGDHYLVFRDRLNALHLGTEHKRKPPHVFKRDPDFSDE
jgi:NAD+ synthase